MGGGGRGVCTSCLRPAGHGFKRSAADVPGRAEAVVSSVAFVGHAHDDFRGHILFLVPVPGNHQREGNEGVVWALA